MAEVSAILKGADIDYKDQSDIEVEIWRKYILNCAFNVMTAFMIILSGSCGVIR